MWLNVTVDTEVAYVIGDAMRRPPTARTIAAAIMLVTSAGTVAATGAVVGSTPAHAQSAEAQVDNLQNYVWRTDPISKALAGKPTADKVLHRVPGSFFDAPRTPPEAEEARRRGRALYGPSTPLYVGSVPGQEVMCTATVAGYNDRGEKIAITAGHCGKVGDAVRSADAWQLGRTGTITHVNGQLDYAVITLAANTDVTRTYNGVTVNHLGGAPIKPGGVVCKTGVASGTTCGPTFTDWDARNTNHVCAMQGDSGAPLTVGDRVIGMVNGGMWGPPFNVSCRTPLQGPIHAPTGSLRMDAVLGDIPGGFRLP